LACAIVLAGASAAAAFLYAHHLPAAQPTDVSHYIGGPIRVRGVVEGDRDERQRTLVLHVRAQTIEDAAGWHDASGVFLARLPLSEVYLDGDLVELRGKLISPPVTAGFDYRSYLANQGIYAESDYPSTRLLAQDASPGVRHGIFLLRNRLDRGIRDVMPEPEASLGAGMALGTRRVTDPSLSAALSTTDAAMIAIATGYNVTVVGMLTLSGLAWLIGRREAAAVAIAVMFAYAVLLGPYPSILRAAAMGTIVMASIVVGRPHAAVRALVIASAVMIALDPGALKSISFPLTLAATAGVVWLAPPASRVVHNLLNAVRKRDTRSPASDFVADNVSMTFAAILPALPVIMAASNRLSLSSIPVNLLLFPLVPALTALSLATAFAGAVWHPLALVGAPVSYALLWFMIFVVRIGADLPGAQLSLPWFRPWTAISLYAGIALGVSFMRSRSHWSEVVEWRLGESLNSLRGRLAHLKPTTSTAPGLLSYGWRPRTIAFLLAAVAAAIPILAIALIGQSENSGTLRVTYLDVGSGSAILVQTEFRRVLVNAGPAGDATVRALDRVLPPWERSINLVVLTDSTAGHAGGLNSLIGRYRVGGVLDAGAMGPAANRLSSKASDWQTEPLLADVVKIPFAPASYLQLGSWQMAVRAPPPIPDGLRTAETQKLADAHATVLLMFGSRRIVLAGDPTATLAADVRSIDRTNASSPPVTPRVAVLETTQSASVVPDVGPALGSALVYRTAENGDVTVTVSTRQLQVRVARGPRLGIIAPK
jgi:competence protein ComEC